MIAVPTPDDDGMMNDPVVDAGGAADADDANEDEDSRAIMKRPRAACETGCTNRA